MLEQKISDLITVGADQFYLEYTVVATTSIKGDRYVLFAIDRLLSSLKTLGLTVTLRAAKNLEVIRDELSKLGIDAKIGKERAARLRSTMSELRATLWAESGGMIAYIVSERRIPIEYLIEDVRALFAK